MNLIPPFAVMPYSDNGPTTGKSTHDELCWLVVNRHKEAIIMAKKQEDAQLFCKLLNKEFTGDKS